eukprot:10437688-Ditylum_brightwellii.AAC.1
MDTKQNQYCKEEIKRGVYRQVQTTTAGKQGTSCLKLPTGRKNDSSRGETLRESDRSRRR